MKSNRVGACLESIDDVRRAILDIIDRQAKAAEHSAYDWKVCVQAVAEARRVFSAVALKGTPKAYANSVALKLRKARDDYYDPKGEFTCGRSEIGSIVSNLETLLPRIIE